MDAAGTAQGGALAHHVIFLGQAGADQPAGEAGVAAAGDRVLGDTHAGGEGTHFEIGLAAVARTIPRADHAQAEIAECRKVRPQLQDFGARAQHHRGPARAVVDPVRGTDRAGGDPQSGGDARQQLRVERPGAKQRRRLEGEPSNTRPRKDTFREHCTAEQEPGLQPRHCHDGDERVAQPVFDDDPHLAHTLGARGAYVIRLQHLEHLGTRHLCDYCHGDRSQRHSGEHKMPQRIDERIPIPRKQRIDRDEVGVDRNAVAHRDPAGEREQIHTDFTRLVCEQPQQHPPEPEHGHGNAEQRADARRGVERSPMIDCSQEASRDADDARDDHRSNAELDRRRKIRDEFLRYREVIGERATEVAVQHRCEIRSVLNVPWLVQFEFMRQVHHVGVRGPFAQQYLDWISGDEMEK